MEDIIKKFKNREPYISRHSEMAKSSVIVPLVKKDNKLFLIFEVRSKKLKSQPGDICFPGGKIEEGEEPIETALRETYEELGLKDLKVVTELDLLVKYNNIIIHSFLCIVNNINELKINEDEVEEVIYVSLEDLLLTKPIEVVSKITANRGDNFPYNLINSGENYNFKDGYNKSLFYEIGSIVIWGITGEILFNFIEDIKFL